MTIWVADPSRSPRAVAVRFRHYHSEGTGTTPLRPFDGDVSVNGPDIAALFTPGGPTGGTYTVLLTCDHGGALNFPVTY
jgi:hypothetical protein